MNNTVTRILFVCSGNICRSPLAEAILRAELDRRGTNGSFVVHSAGTHADHLGQDADPRMRAVARRRGHEVNHRARRVRPTDLSEYDHIIAMDGGHLRILHRYASSPEIRDRITLFRSYDPEVAADRVPDVPDPWYGEVRDFENVHDIVERTCRVMAEKLTAEPHAS